MIKLGRLYLDNFKSFYNAHIFDFRDRDLVLFDGPNGFGKTTIFDAIELCFRGDINRIQATDNKLKSTHPLKYYADKDTIICLEIVNTNTCATYAIYVSIPKSEKKSDNKIGRGTSKFSIKRSILNHFPESLNKLEKVSEDNFSDLCLDDKTIDDVIDNENLKNTFNIFNYIQQEETSHFLKLNESDRHKTINYLFGTVDENDELKTLEDIRNKLSKNEEENLNPRKEGLQKELNEIGQSTIENFEKFESSEVAGSGKIFILHELQKTDDNTDERLINIKKQLSSVQWLLQNPKTFLQLRFNHLIDIMLHKRDDQLRNLLYIGHYEDFKFIEKNVERRNKIREFKIRKHNFEKVIRNHSEIINNNLTADIIDQYFFEASFNFFSKKKESFNAQIEQLNRLNREVNSYEEILTSLSAARHRLNSEYQRLLKEEITNDIHCPLCGVKKESIKTLQEEYTAQSKQFKEFHNSTIIHLQELNEILKHNLLIPIYKCMKRYISMNEVVLLEEKILNKRILSKENWDSVQKIKNWLEEYQMEYSSLLFDFKTSNDTYISLENERLQQLKETISLKIIPLELEYSYNMIDEALTTLKLVVQKKNIENIQLIDTVTENLITPESINIDLEYIQYIQSKKMHSSFQRKQKELQKIESQITLVTEEVKKINGLIQAYKQEIRKYEQQVVNEISIPFYVYSAKILQTRLEGSGIFLETATGRENGFIRFSPTANDDHDAWNTMSSGQISGLVISFMLAMNRVYPTQLKVLLIDDPVQSMDEINMISFIQLLRYEFPDYQIILSTHDNNVSNYFEYKYLTFNKSTETVNLKELRVY